MGEGGWGQQEQFSPGLHGEPQYKGPPNSAELIQIFSESGSSSTPQPKKFISLYCWFQVSLLLIFASFMLLMQILN